MSSVKLKLGHAVGDFRTYQEERLPQKSLVLAFEDVMMWLSHRALQERKGLWSQDYSPGIETLTGIF